jgi:hypothetical protein
VRAILQALLGSAVRRLQFTELEGAPQEAGIGQENPAGPERHRGKVTLDQPLPKMMVPIKAIARRRFQTVWLRFTFSRNPIKIRFASAAWFDLCNPPNRHRLDRELAQTGRALPSYKEDRPSCDVLYFLDCERRSSERRASFSESLRRCP